MALGSFRAFNADIYLYLRASGIIFSSSTIRNITIGPGRVLRGFTTIDERRIHPIMQALLILATDPSMGRRLPSATSLYPNDYLSIRPTAHHRRSSSPATRTMSGLEVLGAAASLIQIADAGLKLYAYIDSIASANKRITRVAKNLETTCNVVKEIGEVFQRQETARLVSKSAVKTAQDAAEECNSVFAELREAVEKSGGNRFGFPFREGRLEVLSLQLEKLKSTLLLLMALLIHARVLVDG